MARLQLDPNAGRRPQQETWSAVEYAQHTADVTRELVRLVAEAVDQPVPPLQGPDLTSLGAVVEAFAASLPAAERRLEVAVVEWPFTITVQGAVQHLLHDVEHHVLDVRRGPAKLALSDATEIFTVTRP